MYSSRVYGNIYLIRRAVINPIFSIQTVAKFISLNVIIVQIVKSLGSKTADIYLVVKINLKKYKIINSPK